MSSGNRKRNYRKKKKEGDKFFGSGLSVENLARKRTLEDPTGGFFDSTHEEGDAYETPNPKSLKIADEKISAAIEAMMRTREEMDSGGKIPPIEKQAGFWRYRVKHSTTKGLLAQKCASSYRYNEALDPKGDNRYLENIQQVTILCANNDVPMNYHKAPSGKIFCETEKEKNIIERTDCYKDLEAAISAEKLHDEKISRNSFSDLAKKYNFILLEGHAKSLDENGEHVSEMIGFVFQDQIGALCFVFDLTVEEEYVTHFYVINNMDW